MSIAQWPDASQRVAALKQVVEQRPKSVEARLRLANNLVETGARDEAEQLLRELEAEDPWEWRARWYRGRLLLARGQAAEAQHVFDQVYFDLPGELAPKLAFAMAAEEAGNEEIAARMYDLVSRTDPAFVSACFGLARCLVAAGDRKGAIAALDRIPKTSSLYLHSRVETARALAAKTKPVPCAEELAAASAMIEAMSVGASERHRLAHMIYRTALDLVLSRALPPNPALRILGRPLQEDYLRAGLEQSCRALARMADGGAKIRLVDEANRVRPRTFL
jgi:serine/threonine-protein kinase PknG